VIETNPVPKTRIVNGMFLTLEGGEKEPIGKRIIARRQRIREETELLRNPRSVLIAYSPFGSIKKGEALVMKGGRGKTTQ
jgi:hypothetical protein